MAAQVRRKNGSNNGGSGAGLTLSFDAAAAAGNALFVTLTLPIASTFVDLVAGANTFTLDRARELNQAGTAYVYFLSAVNITGTPASMVLRTDVDSAVFYFIEEVSGIASTSYVSDTPARVTGTGTAVSAGITTSTNNAYARALLTLSGPQTAVGGDGFTAYPGTSATRQGLYLEDTGAAGGKNITATLGATELWVVSSIVYKNAGGGGVPTVSTVGAASAVEGSPITSPVTLSAATTATTNFAATLVGSGTHPATVGTDIAALSAATFTNGVTFSGGNMVVPSGVSGWDVILATSGNTTDDFDKTVTLTVGSVPATLTITDDDALPGYSISDATQSGGTVVFTVSLNAPSGREVTVQVDTANGTSTAGVDYTAIVGQIVTFAPGETSKTVTVTVL